MVNIPGGTDRIVAALDRNDIDAGKNATPYLIQAVLKGSDAVAVISQTANPVYSLIVRPEIKSFAELKGKTIGLSTPGDTITLSATRLLAAKGIRDGDYTAKPVVGTPARFACLKSGDCAARADGPAGRPRRHARKASLASPSPTKPAPTSSSTSTWCGAPGASRTRTRVVRFVRAFASAYEFMNDPKNRDEVVALIAEAGGYSEDARAARFLRPISTPDKNVLPRRGELDLGAFARVLALMGEGGVIPKSETPPEKFVDLQYLKAAGIQ